ncbi:MAG: hypothetical protein ABIS86_00085 [Streptosporangiaceae bacterium]
MNRQTIIAAVATGVVAAGAAVALAGVSFARDEGPNDPVVRKLSVEPDRTTADPFSPERTRSAKPRPLPEGP